VSDERAGDFPIGARPRLPLEEKRLRVFVLGLHVGGCRRFRCSGLLLIRRAQHGDGNGDTHAEDERDGDEGGCHATAVQFLAEHGEEAAFERGLACHREAAGSRPARG
jgi:hypothetical protein